MSSINQQPLANPLTLADLIAVWSSGNGDTRRASLTALLALIQANLTFPVTPVAPGQLIFMPFVGGIDTILVSPAAGVVLPATPDFGQTIEFIAVGTNTGPATVEVDGQPVYALEYKGLALAGGEVAVGGSTVAIFDGTAYQLVASAVTTPGVTVELEYACQGRVTTVTGTPVPTTDQLAVETLYFTPFRGNRIDLYDPGTAAWVRRSFTEITLDVPDANQTNDVFIYHNGANFVAEAVAWTNDVTRATPLALQDGVLIKSGTPARRYVGSFYSTTAGNGQTEDSLAKRNVWNYYNRVVRPMKVIEATNSWVYSTAAWHQANAAAANQLEYVQGVSEDPLSARVNGMWGGADGTFRPAKPAGIGVDSATVNSASLTQVIYATSAMIVSSAAFYSGFPGIGRHQLMWLEYGNATGGAFYGDNGAAGIEQSGIQGEIFG